MDVGIQSGRHRVSPQSGETIDLDRAVLELPDGRAIALPCCPGQAGSMTIGRGSQAMLRIDDPHVSRIHAEIRWDAAVQAHLIHDRGSVNGTFVNDIRIEWPVHLLDGERIHIGRTELHYGRHVMK